MQCFGKTLNYSFNRGPRAFQQHMTVRLKSKSILMTLLNQNGREYYVQYEQPTVSVTDTVEGLFFCRHQSWSDVLLKII